MTLWFFLALMTVAAIFAVLLPLGRAAPASPGGTEAAVYKDQLAEIERDLAAGLLGPAEAEAARVEIARRLLAAGRHAFVVHGSPSLSIRRAVAIVALIGLPLFSGALYLAYGRPGLVERPVTAAQAPAGGGSIEQMIAQVQDRLAKNPDDGRGWEVLAPVLLRLGRADEGVIAQRNVIRLLGESAARRADLGEALAMAANGIVTVEARAEFERAKALDAAETKASYFLGLAAEQDGQREAAATIWRDLLRKAPADAPWRPLVQSALARVSSVGMPALSDEQKAAGDAMAPADRSAMIQGMVEGLAERLKQNGDDVPGWLRLVRAYMVLGDNDKARDAARNAREAVPDHKKKQLGEGLIGIGFGG